MSPRQKTNRRGICPTCRMERSLMMDGRVYRHYGLPAGDSWPDGICRGWGARPLTAPIPADEP